MNQIVSPFPSERDPRRLPLNVVGSGGVAAILPKTTFIGNIEPVFLIADPAASLHTDRISSPLSSRYQTRTPERPKTQYPGRSNRGA